MDRFKFRIWNKSSKKYSDIGLNTALTINNLAENYIIQQCLGVKDKNNRLIYEGDIVEWRIKEINKENYKTKNISSSIGEITWWTSFVSFTIKQITLGKYIYSVNLEDEDKEPIFQEEQLELYFYDKYEGYPEFKWNELEVIGSIATNSLINLNGNLVKELIKEDKCKSLELLK